MSQVSTFAPKVTPGSGPVFTLTGNTGGPVSPDGVGNINVIDATTEGSSSITGNNGTHTLSMAFTDVDQNVVLGTTAFESTRTVSTAVANTGVGFHVFNAVTTGDDNTAVGNGAGAADTTGRANLFLGVSAGGSVTTGSRNIILGNGVGTGSAYTTESDNILIGNAGTVADAHALRIGTNGSGNGQINKTFIAGIDGVNVGSTATVVTEANNQLGTAVITAGSGISVTPGANTITIAATGGSGTVTSISAGTGITLTPNPITTTGTVALTVPVSIANGGTNATSMATTDGTVYYDGTRLVTTATGTSGQILTSNGAGVAPSYQSPAASSITITGDSGGGLTSGSFTFTGGTTGITFSGAGTTETLTGTLVVANGGTGRATLTNHGLLVGAGTSAITQLSNATNGQLPIGSTGADPVLATITAGSGITVTNGAGTITIANSASSGALTLIQTQTAVSVAELDFTTGISSTYNNYLVLIHSLGNGGTSNGIIQISTNGGSTYITTGYLNSGGISNTDGFGLPPTSLSTIFVSAVMTIYNLTSGTGIITCSNNNNGQFNTVGPTVGNAFNNFCAYGTASTAANALRLKFSDGSNFSGTMSLYGYSK